MLRLFSLVVLCLPLALYAQEEPDQLDNIVVSASRVPIAKNRSGNAISIINREYLERRQSALLVDVLRDVPGIAVSRTGTFGSTTQIRLRGAEANHVLVLIDGVEINDPGSSDEVDFAHLSARNIERIEIVRGPQSALWGSDALAGVINIVTTEANRPFSFEGYVEAGSFSNTHAGANVSGLGENFSYSGGVSYLDTDGTNISRQGNEDDGYDNFTLNFKTQVNLSENLSFNASARRTDATTEFDAVDFLTTGLPVDNDLETEIDQTYGRLGLDLKAGPWLHGFKLDYLDTTNENLSDGVFNTSQGGEKLGLSYQAVLGWVDQNLIFAVDYETDDFQQRGLASAFGDPNQDQDRSTTGYVVEYRSQAPEAIDYSVSVRYDDNSDSDSIFTYRGAASYQLSDLTRLRASVGTGQKRPTFTELFGFFPDQFLGNPGLDPEESFSWEIGVERDFGPVTAELGYFNERLEDEINPFVFDLDTFLFTAENQSGTSRREGLEFSIAGDITERLALSASYTYTDSDEPDGSGGSQRELRRPRNRASLNLNFVPSDRSNVNLNVTYNGEQLDLFFPPFPMPSERLTLESYTLVNLTGYYSINDSLRITARIENLLDEEFEEVFGFQAPGIGAYAGVQFGIN